VITTTTETSFADPAKHAAGVKTLLHVKKILGTLGVPFFLSHGTLLGAIRDHDFLPHDSDIDLGIWDDCGSHLRIYVAFAANDFRLAHEFGSHGHGHQFAFWSPDGVYVDLFFYQRDEDHCYATIHTPSGPRRQVFPARPSFPSTIEFCGSRFVIPSNAEAWLEANYGPDWRTPVAPVERGGTWDWAESPLNYEDTK
jgi:phosphorylcholine metabolism protein LicD